MLRYLRIRDFALIRELEVEFAPGLSLLTGETGSGKSILVDVLGLLLGERASPEMVRTNSEAAVLEGVFVVEACGAGFGAALEAGGIGLEDDSLIIRREISLIGRSRIFINGNLATLSQLRAVGGFLADIHGQHDRQTLLDRDTHVEWLDRYGGNKDLARDTADCYSKTRAAAAQLESMKMDEQERLRRIDILRHQINEIGRVNPQPGERESLEIERGILMHRERIFALTSEAFGLLYEREPSLVSEANRLQKILQELEQYDAGWAPHRDALREYIYRLEDLAFSARDYSSRIDFTPGRLDEVELRLSDLDRLAQKYGQSVEQVLDYSEKRREELEQLLAYADNSKLLTDQVGTNWAAYLELAERLSHKRRSDALRLEKALTKEFHSLALEKMQLGVSFAPTPTERGITGGGKIPAGYGPHGMDHIEFQVAPNKGEEMKPLARIASGGELSRVMLAIRSLCGGEDRAKTLVFDEVDAGIGGRAAEAVGRRLHGLSQNHQVLCVTHLPQIAAFADNHFCVRKHVEDSRTLTSIELLGAGDRVEELARMLGGEVITETARKHAREMLLHSAETSQR